MDLKEILRSQHVFDERHGWALRDQGSTTLLALLNHDMIGVFGEIGEFANIIKKLNLEQPHVTEDELAAAFSTLKPHLADELIDVFIYVIRIATHLNIDIEAEYMNKLGKNELRFERFRTDIDPK